MGLWLNSFTGRGHPPFMMGDRTQGRPALTPDTASHTGSRLCCSVRGNEYRLGQGPESVALEFEPQRLFG
jgi:hypothetical protein